jgi:MOSC domain-containing protein YiiM
MTTKPHVAAIFVAKVREQPSIRLERIRAFTEAGLEGCRHAAKAKPGGKRQVLLADADALARMGLEPGQLKENFLIAGLDLGPLVPGQRLAIGPEVRLEVTMGCVPCQKVDRIRPGLMKESWHQRGQLCRVIQGGEVKEGDEVQLLDINAAAPRPVYPKLPA